MKYFILIFFLFLSTANAFNAEECRSKIKKIIYVGAAPSSEAKYVEPFIKTFDLLPLEAQKFMCKFDKFSLHSMNVSAYADMRFRIGIFDAKIDASRWNSWKDQLNFGAKNDDNFRLKKDLPVFTTTSGVPFLYWIMLHELGHNIEFNESDWSLWNSFYDEDHSLFPQSSRLCFYSCINPIPAHEAPLIYKEIFEKTNFLSLYSTLNAWEYWAETFMYYVAIELTDLDSNIIMPDGTSYKIKDRLMSPGFATRRDMAIRAYNSLKDIEPMSKTLHIQTRLH